MKTAILFILSAFIVGKAGARLNNPSEVTPIVEPFHSPSNSTEGDELPSGGETYAVGNRQLQAIDEPWYGTWGQPFLDVFDTSMYYTIHRSDNSEKYIKATANDNGEFFAKRIKKYSNSNWATKIIEDPMFHWRFEHVPDTTQKFRMINRGNGQSAIFAKVGSNNNWQWSTLAVDSTDNRIQDKTKPAKVRIFPSGSVGQWSFRAEWDNGGTQALAWADSNDKLVPKDQASTVRFVLNEVRDFYPADADPKVSQFQKREHSRHINSYIRQGSLALIKAAGNKIVPLFGTISEFAVGQVWKDNTEERKMSLFAKAIRDMVKEMISDSHARENIQRGADLTSTNRVRYVDSFMTKAKYWLGQPQTDPRRYVDHIGTHVITFLENIITTQHDIIAENLVDLDYDPGNDISVRTAQQGFILLELAVWDAIGMVEDYVSLLSYQKALDPDIGNDTWSCLDFVNDYVKEATKYEVFVDYLKNTYEMMYARRIGDANGSILNANTPIGDMCSIKEKWATDVREVYRSPHSGTGECLQTPTNSWTPVKNTGVGKARTLYRNEVMWDMAHFSYGYDRIKDRMLSFENHLINNNCFKTTVDPAGWLSQAFSPLLNLSTGKTATQLSTYSNNVSTYGPQKALDGNDQSYTHSLCWQGVQQWWEVDLDGMYTIESIEVVNRLDAAGDRLHEFTFAFKDKDGAEVDNFQTQGGNGDRKTYDVDSITARYVRITLGDQDCLQLGEVRVMGY